MSAPVLALRGVSQQYGMGRTAVSALSGIDLEIDRGELVAVMGPSGSGKSTLLSIAGGLARPTAGEVVVEGNHLSTGLAMVLVVAAGAVCLGLSRFERRPDDATLAAVGATRRLRRGIGAWQALIVVGLGTLVGTVAALISIWGLTHMSHSMSFTDAPWPWLVLLAAGLPAGMAAASWLAPPREPDLTHRTAIA